MGYLRTDKQEKEGIMEQNESKDSNGSKGGYNFEVMLFMPIRF